MQGGGGGGLIAGKNKSRYWLSWNVGIKSYGIICRLYCSDESAPRAAGPPSTCLLDVHTSYYLAGRYSS